MGLLGGFGGSFHYCCAQFDYKILAWQWKILVNFSKLPNCSFLIVFTQHWIQNICKFWQGNLLSKKQVMSKLFYINWHKYTFTSRYNIKFTWVFFFGNKSTSSILFFNITLIFFTANCTPKLNNKIWQCGRKKLYNSLTTYVKAFWQKISHRMCIAANSLSCDSNLRIYQMIEKLVSQNNKCKVDEWCCSRWVNCKAIKAYWRYTT